jgi:F0F1-type ATP synthase assembly protein I
VAAGAYIGYRLDMWLGTQGVFTLLLSLVALVMGVRLMLDMKAQEPSEGSDSSSEHRLD